ncbi:hypothetical protein N665_0031s0017 [Sinapis alba]|nr:hypothetical protein N665_0031s0017 [Sinapis alba]
MQDIKTVQVKNEDRKGVIFLLRDTNGNNMECCLWKKYAEHIKSHLAENEGQPIICLIRFVKISYYKALDFKQRMLQAELPLSIVQNKLQHKAIKQQAEDWDDFQVSSISEILVEQKCKIICSIESIDTDWGWFFFGHDRCNHWVTRIGGNDPQRIAQNEKPLFRCELCRTNVTNVSPKYKLHVYVADDSDSCKIMLLNFVGKTVIGKDVVELWNGSYDETIGKSFCFGISISSDNVTKGADTYLVSEVRAGEEIHQIESQIAPVSLIETGSSTFCGGEVSVFHPNSQNCSEDVTRPFSKRKEKDDLPDMTSTSKKLCTTTLKLEKSKTK